MRRAGEGVDDAQWGTMVALKKKDESSDESEDEEDNAKDDEKKGEKKAKKKVILITDLLQTGMRYGSLW